MSLKSHISSIKLLTILFGALSIILYTIMYFLKNTFGHVEIQQII